MWLSLTDCVHTPDSGVFKGTSNERNSLAVDKQRTDSPSDTASYATFFYFPFMVSNLVKTEGIRVLQHTENGE